MREPAPGLSVAIDEVRFGDRPVLRDFRLNLAGGRWSCFLGPSGCGKSTLLRVIAGLLPGGVVVADDGGPVHGRLAFMAQSDLLLPWLSVRENAILGWRLRGAGRRDLRAHRDRADGLLAQLGLAEQAGTAPQTLSGGMRQRAALARTLAEARPIVVMDEPFSALDAITRHHLQALAARLLTGRTVVLVTHDPREALRLGDDIFVMSGRPAQVSGPLRPAGTAPRDITDPALIATERRLLGELAAGGTDLATGDEPLVSADQRSRHGAASAIC